MSHFTYTNSTDQETLMQGDIIEKNEDICSLIKEVHPHYIKDDYKYFIVLTQSCDLVRRDGAKCKAPYISLAAVRPFDLLIQRELAKHQKTEIELKGKLCNQGAKRIVHQFVERLLNNNEPEYFYLHEDTSLNFSQPMVAFLRLSIAIKSNLHYDKCLKAKRVELTENFRAKLGWHVGQMYSRVGTQDWVPDVLDSEKFQKKCELILNQSAVWHDEKVIKEIRKKESEFINLATEDIQKAAEKIIPPKRKEIALERIRDIIMESGFLEKEHVEKLTMRILNDRIVSSLFPK